MGCMCWKTREGFYPLFFTGPGNTGSPGERMTEVLGAIYRSSSVCWREDKLQGSLSEAQCAHLGPSARARRTSLPWPRDLGAQAPISSCHPLAQTAENRCSINRFMVIFILVKTHAHVHYNDELHCSPAGFLESPPENVLANGSVVNSGNTSGLNPATSRHRKLS